MSSTGSLPALAAFELPVYVRRPLTAAELLAGGRKINDALLNPEYKAELHLRPGDPLSHPVNGDRHATNNFLLTVRKVPQSSSAGSSAASNAVECEIRGHVTTTYRWESLADFQYVGAGMPTSIDGRFVHTFLSSVVKDVPADMMTLASAEASGAAASMGYQQRSQSTAGAASSSAAPLVEGGSSSAAAASAGPPPDGAGQQNTSFPWVSRFNERMNLPPVVFSHIDRPLDYAFRGPSTKELKEVVSGPGGETEGKATYAGADRRSIFSLIHAHHVWRDGVPVPTEAREVPLPTMPAERGKKLMESLKHAFDVRPAWTLLSLSMFLGVPSKDFRFQMPAVAYFVRGGAFRNCWLRLGWDPRACPTVARCYQTVDIKIPPSHSQRVPSTVQADKARKLKGAAAGQAADADDDDDDGDADADLGEALAGAGPGPADGCADGASGSGPAKPGDFTWTRWAGGILVRRAVFQLIDLMTEGLETWLVDGKAAKNKLTTASESAVAAASTGREGGGTITTAADIGPVVSSPNPETIPDPFIVIGRGNVQIVPQDRISALLSFMPRATSWSSGTTGWMPKSTLDILRKNVTTAVCAHIDRYGPAGVEPSLSLSALLGSGSAPDRVTGQGEGALRHSVSSRAQKGVGRGRGRPRGSGKKSTGGSRSAAAWRDADKDETGAGASEAGAGAGAAADDGPQEDDKGQDGNKQQRPAKKSRRSSAAGAGASPNGPPASARGAATGAGDGLDPS